MRTINQSQGSTLLVAMLVIGGLSAAVATYYSGLVPKFRGTHQGVGWHEALHGADAGVDIVVNSLNSWASSTPNPQAYPWTANGWSFTDPNFTTNGERTLDVANLPFLGGPNRLRITKLAVDIYTRENVGSAPTYNPWFRVRSTARASLPGKFVSSDPRDIGLRRMKLGATTNSGLPDPHVTRTVEVILRPRYQVRRAITTLNDLVLGTSSSWEVDSFDSEDPAKSSVGTSAGGIYSGANSPKVQSNAGIASAKQNPSDNPYGPLISGNGATVRGDIETNGGDDPATMIHENISGATNMDPNRISSTFDEDIAIPTAPAWSSWTYQGNNPGSFVSGTKANPTRYAITGNLGTFAVTAPATGTGYIEIIVTGNLSTGNGNGNGITIPPNVYATIWVQGNVDFANGMINTNAQSSKVASHLIVHGVSTAPLATFVASGTAVQSLIFDGPNYSATLNGTVETTGSFIVKNFYISGGGNGGFHFDEEIARGTPIVGWEVASYFEDSHADL
jgi:hypothetical protein